MGAHADARDHREQGAKIVNDPLQILICGTPLMRNKGGAALVAGAVASVRTALPQAKFRLLSMDPADVPFGPRYGVDVATARLWQMPVSFIAALIYRLSALVGLRLTGLLKCTTFLREYRRADLILNMTGIGFHDSFGKMVIIKHALWILPALLIKKPLILYSQSMGPFESAFNRALARWCLSHIQAIVVRGESSRRHLSELGIRVPVFIHPDVGFLLEPADAKRVEQIFAEESIIHDNRPLVGVAVNQVINHPAYAQTLGGALDFLAEKLNGRVLFIPHANDDRTLAERIKEQMKASSVMILKKDYPAEELKGIIGRCDYFLGSRFHSIVASLSMGVPTLVIGWSHKYRELMGLFGMEEFVLDQNASPEDLKSGIDKLCAKQENIKEELRRQIDHVRARAADAGGIVREVAKDRHG